MKITKQSLRRALRTFVQAVVAYLTVHVVLIDFTGERVTLRTALVGLLVSALAAGLSAVMNLERKEENENDNEQLGE